MFEPINKLKKLMEAEKSPARNFDLSERLNLTERMKPFASTLSKVKDSLRMPEFYGQAPIKYSGKVGEFQKKVEDLVRPENQAENMLNVAIDVSNPMGVIGRVERKVVPKLTTKFLEYAKGKVSLSRQEILDFARRPELKKGEADLLLKKLEEFMPKTKGERKPFDVDYYSPSKGDDFTLGHFDTKEEAQSFINTLTGEKRKYAKIAKFMDQSPKLPAQEFTDSIRRDLLELKPVKVKDPQYTNVSIDNANVGQANRTGTRMTKSLDDLHKNYEEVVFESPITTNGSSHFPNSKNYFAHARGDEVVENGKKIWREQEIQSDLLQKDNLENQTFGLQWKPSDKKEFEALLDQRKNLQENSPQWDILTSKLEEVASRFDNARAEKGTQLSPFTNDRFGERIMRERIKAKAKAGYSKYRLPTGETIGKIEGFGQDSPWIVYEGGFKAGGTDFGTDLTVNKIKTGLEVRRDGSDWIITDILGDGRFKAVPKKVMEEGGNEYTVYKDGRAMYSTTKKSLADKYVAEKGGDAKIKSIPLSESLKETFDLTGKSNPQAKRYDNWGKFLKNKYGGKEVVDPQGNNWVEIDLKPEYRDRPVEAFGKGRLDSLVAIGAGSAVGAAGAVGLSKTGNVVEAEGPDEEVIKEPTVKDLRVALFGHESRGIEGDPSMTVAPGTGATGASQVTQSMLDQYNKLTDNRLTTKDIQGNPELQIKITDHMIEWIMGRYENGLDYFTGPYREEILKDFNDMASWVAGEWVAGPQWVKKLDNPTAEGAKETVRDYIKEVKKRLGQ